MVYLEFMIQEKSNGFLIYNKKICNFMKYLKKFEKIIITDQEIFKEFLEKIKTWANTTEENYIDYEWKNNKTLEMEYGWSSYEEGYCCELVIEFDAKINVIKKEDGYSVMGGNYDDKNETIYNNVDELITEIKKDFFDEY